MSAVLGGLLPRFAALLLAIGLVAFVVAGFVALGDVDLGACVAVTGRRARLIGYYACSPHLLAGSPRALFVFLWLWSFPTVAALALLIPRLKSRFAPRAPSSFRN